MIRLRLYLWCILLISTISMEQALAQTEEQEQKNISGMVLERGTANVRIADATVVNLRTRQVTRTSPQGVFTIPVAVGDSLSVNKIGYGPIKTVINTLEDIILDMQAGLEIETVVVTRSTRESELRSHLRDYERQGIHNGGHNSLGTYLNSPATALYNLFGRTPRNARRFEQYMNQELEATKVDRVFNKTLVSSLTDLEGDELQSFMDIYRPSWSTLEKWGQYDLMLYITNSFKSWDKNGRPKSERLPKLEIPEQER